MSLDLVDLRAKVTAETHVALGAYARAHDIDVSEVVRDVLQEWTLRQVRAAKLIVSALEREGVVGASKGLRGE